MYFLYSEIVQVESGTRLGFGGNNLLLLPHLSPSTFIISDKVMFYLDAFLLSSATAFFGHNSPTPTASNALPLALISAIYTPLLFG